MKLYFETLNQYAYLNIVFNECLYYMLQQLFYYVQREDFGIGNKYF